MEENFPNEISEYKNIKQQNIINRNIREIEPAISREINISKIKPPEDHSETNPELMDIIDEFTDMS